MSDSACPLCRRIADGETRLELEVAVAIHDAYPLASGHTLVIPRRHIGDFFETTAAEQAACWELVAAIAARLRDEGADGVNVGLNAGRAAGQTVDHAHIHVIPRTHGDVADPRGGVRWVIPKRAAYWDTPGWSSRQGR